MAIRKQGGALYHICESSDVSRVSHAKDGSGNYIINVINVSSSKKSDARIKRSKRYYGRLKYLLREIAKNVEYYRDGIVANKPYGYTGVELAVRIKVAGLFYEDMERCLEVVLLAFSKECRYLTKEQICCLCDIQKVLRCAKEVSDFYTGRQHYIKRCIKQIEEIIYG